MEQGPGLFCLTISPGMDAVHAGLLSNHQSVICTSYVFLVSTVQFGIAVESHVGATLIWARARSFNVSLELEHKSL